METTLTYPQYRAFFMILFATDAKDKHLHDIKTVISSKAAELLIHIEHDYYRVNVNQDNLSDPNRPLLPTDLETKQSVMETKFPKTYTETDADTIKTLLIFIILFNRQVFGEDCWEIVYNQLAEIYSQGKTGETTQDNLSINQLRLIYVLSNTDLNSSTFEYDAPMSTIHILQ